MIARIPNYNPGPDSKRFHASQSKYLFVISGVRSGKTHSFRQQIIKDSWNNPTDFGVLVCGPTYRQMYEMYERPIVSMLQDLGLCKENNKTEHRTVLRNGKVIYWRSLEDPDTAVRSLDVWRMFCGEITLCTEYSLEVMKSRLVLCNDRILCEGNPKGMSNWFYQKYIGPNKQVTDNMEFMHFSIFNNPLITPEAEMELRSLYDPLMARQEVDGEWIPLSDKTIYYAFSRERNVRDVPMPPDGEVTYCGLDYNIGINANVSAWKDFKRNEIYVFDEGYGDKTTADVGRTLIRKHGNPFVLDDATGNNRQQGDARTQREILNQVGLYQISSNTSNPPVDKRQSVVNAHFHNGLGQTHLFIHPRCTKLIHECENLSRRPGSLEVDTQGGKAGHITDALGYLVYYLSGGTAAWAPPPEPVTYAKH